MTSQRLHSSSHESTTAASVQTGHRLTPRGWWLLTLLSLAISFYALGHVVLGERVYSPLLADSFRARPWGIYPHAFFGMIALALGPFQFRRGLLVRRPHVHRALGKLYLISAIGTGAAGLYMSVYSFGGIVTHVGFATLAAGLLLSTVVAWIQIRRGNIALHREWVIRSFALLFSAVTLRLWLPLLTSTLGEFPMAYLWVAWVCWLPNLLAAELYLRFARNRGWGGWWSLRPPLNGPGSNGAGLQGRTTPSRKNAPVARP
jgi:uncharacterized membrane protein